MTARTAIVAGLVSLSPEAGVTYPYVGQTPDAVNGNTVPGQGSTVPGPGPNEAIIIVKNADSSPHTMTIRAGGSGVIASGAAAVPSVFEQSSSGDLAVVVAATSTQAVQINNNGRFQQADGSLSLDWDASTSVTVWVITKYYNPI